MSDESLLPAPSEAIEVGGQKLVRVPRKKRDAGSTAGSPEAATSAAAAPESSGPKSLEDVARKYTGVIEEHQELFDELLKPASEGSSPAPPISRIELFEEGAGVVPPSETDPARRSGISLSPIESADDDQDFINHSIEPLTLLDLFAKFPALDGVNTYIYVERLQPKVYQGRPCAGVLRRIDRPIGFDEWAAFYGGGTYKLIVYGPPRRGMSLGPDGRLQPVAKTKPIQLVFPDAPSFDCMDFTGEDLAEDDDMTTQGLPAHIGPRRMPATAPDASIHKATLDADLEREKRREAREERERERERQLQNEVSEAQHGVTRELTTMAKSAAEMQAEFRREMMEAEREHQRALREQQDRFEAKIEALKAQKPERDPLEFVTAILGATKQEGASSRDLDRLHESHRHEIERLQQQLRDERERGDRLAKDERERAERNIADAERRFAEQEKSAIERIERQMQQIKDDAQRRIDEMHRQAETRVNDLERNHQRDIQALTSQHQLQVESLKSTYDMRLDSAKSETKRATADAERWKTDAESRKDVVGQLTKLKEDAAQLGMVDASEVGAGSAEPPDWKTAIAQSVPGFLAQLPGVIGSAVETFKGRPNAAQLAEARAAAQQEMAQNAGAAPQLRQGYQRRMPQLPAPGGEIRRLSDFQHAPAPRGRPVPQAAGEIRPMEGPPASVYVSPPNEVPVGFTQIEGALPAPQTQAELAPPSVAPPAPPAAPPSVAPGADPASPVTMEEDRQIHQATLQLRSLFEAGQSPELVAGLFQANTQKGQVIELLQQLGSPERIFMAIERVGDLDSSLLRREGKRFVRELFGRMMQWASSPG